MESKRRYVIAGAEGKEKEGMLIEEQSKMSVSREKSGEANRTVFKSKVLGVRPWRIKQDFSLAFMDAIIAGVGYLLYVSIRILLQLSTADYSPGCWRS